MNFSIIYNPIATKFSQAALDHLIFKFVERGLTLNAVIKSEYAGHVIPLIKKLDPVSDYLITLGGDGTVNEAIRAFNEIEQAFRLRPHFGRHNKRHGEQFQPFQTQPH